MLSLISQLLKGERAGCYGKVIKFSQERPVEEVSAQRKINIRNGINETAVTHGRPQEIAGHGVRVCGQQQVFSHCLFCLLAFVRMFLFPIFLQTGLCLLVPHGAK